MAERDPGIRLGHYTGRAEDYVARGDFESIDHVLGEALDALDRQQQREDTRYETLVREAIAAPGRFVPIAEAFAELDERKRIRRGG